MSELEEQQSGRCWECGYLLRGVESAKCPECGKDFDRANPSSMNFGLPMGRFGRWALASPGWVIMGLPILAFGLIWATVRWPVEGWRFSFMDVGYYARVWEWRKRGNLSWVDLCYSSGIVVIGPTVVCWFLRAALRGIAIKRYRPPVFQRGAIWRRGFLSLLVLMMAGVGMGAGWPYRLGQRWAGEWMRTPSGLVMSSPSFALGWVGDDLARDEAMIRSAVRFGSAREKTAGLKLLIESQNEKTEEILHSAIAREGQLAVRALEIRLLGILRGYGGNPILEGFLNDPEPAIREAAADGLGFCYNLHHLSIWRPNNPFIIDSDPPISISWSERWLVRDDTGWRNIISKMILSGATVGEREAAARAARNWPPAGFQFRYAEWGVFMVDAAGRPQFVQAQLDEIPPFVHRIGNTTKEMEGRISSNMMPVWKPVIHLTASVPLAVDMEVSIHGGRPWVAYPAIDDLMMIQNFENGGFAEPLERPIGPLDLKGFGDLKDLREGYPWILPHHREYPWNQVGNGGLVVNTMGGIGVRWQSLIVSPKKLDWMKPAEIGSSPRFAWWKKLREVDCSWVSSRGESERFLYYDGPSNRALPVGAQISGGKLRLTGSDKSHPGLYIEVTPAGIATRVIDEANLLRSFEVAGFARPTPDAENILLQTLEKRGLTASEASGLVYAWKPAFFRTPGRRFLSFMTSADYDWACPLTIRPAPTEKVRVGIIWTELPL